jgi:hypothetical protein
MRSSRRRIRLGLLLAVVAGAWYLQHRRAAFGEPAVDLPWPPLPPDPVPSAAPTGQFPAPAVSDPPVSDPEVSIPEAPAGDVAAGDVAASDVATGDVAAGWVGPCEGDCPPTHPVKVKLRSGLFHLPGMALYERTKADRCYISAQQAGADGFRPSSR